MWSRDQYICLIVILIISTLQFILRADWTVQKNFSSTSVCAQLLILGKILIFLKLQWLEIQIQVIRLHTFGWYVKTSEKKNRISHSRNPGFLPTSHLAARQFQRQSGTAWKQAEFWFSSARWRLCAVPGERSRSLPGRWRLLLVAISTFCRFFSVQIFGL